MITAIVFSRDRACQLDLLLRSVQQFAPTTIDPLHVLFRATDESYGLGYSQLRFEFPTMEWRQEHDFQSDIHAILRKVDTDLVMCMTDDSFFRREFADEEIIGDFLRKKKDTLCFSLRLGENTILCYPHARAQKVPPFFRFKSARIWEWRRGDGDFGYPGSLDAHIFRKEQFLELIEDRSFSNPNGLEDALVAGCRSANQPLMGCFEQSLVVSVPANRVNESHRNRFGGEDALSEQALNERFLRGERLLLGPLTEQIVNAAHAELQLEMK